MLIRRLLLVLGVILLTNADENVDEAINAALDSKNNAVADDTPKVRLNNKKIIKRSMKI